MTEIGVRLLGTGSAVPDRVLSNADLEKMIDTSDEWIHQRTGIRERRVSDQENGEGCFTLSTRALQGAIEEAGIEPGEMDLIILASVTSEMTCPSNACRVSSAVGATPAAAFDLVAACSGFIYASNIADSLIRSGRHRCVGVIGCDAMSHVIDYDERSVSILFGDAAGAMILRRDEDVDLGCTYQRMYADGERWESLYIPRRPREVPESDRENPIKLGNLRMNGREVYKFAVGKFIKVIRDALEDTGLGVDDIAQFVCHQSNARIIASAKEKLGLPDDKVLINIDKYGNSSAGSVGLCLDQLRKGGKIKAGDRVMMVAFGGGMTWGASIWQL